MKEFIPSNSAGSGTSRHRWLWPLVSAILVFMLIILFRPRPQKQAVDHAGAIHPPQEPINAMVATAEPTSRLTRRVASARELTPEEIVTNKVNQFIRNRRELTRAIARQRNVEVPDELERFFETVEAGHWDEIEALAKPLREHLQAMGLIQLWPPAHETWGAVQEASQWPAQKLLDYGNAVLGALRPGMVYVGGTDPGRWIPTLLNETSEGEHHIVLTQNALADGTYLDYVTFQYGDQLATLSGVDSKRAFDEYLSNARKRLAHDQDFPDEPKQVRPGEQISMLQGKLQVGGQVAVMSINEKLLQILMEKNPDVAFGLQESFPFKSTYADAAPLGPIMELRAPDGPSAFTPERAIESLEYWRSAAQQLLSDPTAAGSQEALLTHSHDAVAAANLLAAHNYSAEAEQTYRLSSQLWPANPEPIGGLSELLFRLGRADEARQLLEDFSRKNPGEREAMERIRATWSLVTPKSL
jgi:hypothetical protein